MKIRPGLCCVAILALLAAPLWAQAVNVYSYRQPDLVRPLFDAFTAKTGIRVNVSFLNQGMIEKLRAEGDRSPADLVFTVDISRLNGLVEAGLTQPVASDILNANIPADFRDPAGHWFGLTTRARVIYAARDRVRDGEITTYEDLADEKWRGRICTRPGTHSYNLALISAYLTHHSKAETRAWLMAIRKNLARKPQGNDRAQIKAVWSGECDIALGNTYYMGQMIRNPDQKAWADAVRIIFPVFEGGGTHVNISGMAMTGAAPNRDNALKLMEFLSTRPAQSLYAEQNFEYPLLADAPVSELVASWGSFSPDDRNLMAIAHLRQTALRLVEEVNFDQ